MLVSKFILIAWVLLFALLFIPPRTPPSAPAGCGLVNGAPIEAASPVPLSARVGQHSPLEEDDPPLSYKERFSHEAIGPDWAWAEGAERGCPVSRAAVHEQGVGE